MKRVEGTDHKMAIDSCPSHAMMRWYRISAIHRQIVAW